MSRFPASSLCATIIWLAFGPSALVAEGRMPSMASALEPSPMGSMGGEIRRLIPQRPLSPDGVGRAFVFIGGMGDEVSGIMDYVSRAMPPAVSGDGETRAYYHWTADLADMDPMAAARCIASHITAYRRRNPGVDVVLLGHSLGASTALKVATLLPEDGGRVFLLTLDPVDRSTTPVRPASVTWWGNAYVQDSLSDRDFIYALGGRWNHCDGADMNLRFRGADADEWGRRYIHDNAPSFLMSRGAATDGSTPAPGRSLFDTLCGRLLTGEAPQRPADGATTGKASSKQATGRGRQP